MFFWLKPVTILNSNRITFAKIRVRNNYILEIYVDFQHNPFKLSFDNESVAKYALTRIDWFATLLEMGSSPVEGLALNQQKRR